jgi:hypothetical protein
MSVHHVFVGELRFNLTTTKKHEVMSSCFASLHRLVQVQIILVVKLLAFMFLLFPFCYVKPDESQSTDNERVDKAFQLIP